MEWVNNEKFSASGEYSPIIVATVKDKLCVYGKGLKLLVLVIVWLLSFNI